ncbi:putative ubiquinol-cytochrome-c reductase complex subunit (QCR10) [Lyophyllum shimeji]|uniref:Ubiquinol-cytochrome-c reductase complex subunit (QCR10) n=1 Tax=Lyophyllum shimeji TaxID=47721 RepID=A0A9P3PFK2_LYOSH|nr:putative ubiquinol-cytochrome-c reductase complex subunit (QCR10) [Lyophyllum shimeji]
MARPIYHPQPPTRVAVNTLKPWAPSIGMWSVGIGSAALLVLSVTPLVKREVLVKVPVLGSYFEDRTPPSDKPF